MLVQVSELPCQESSSGKIGLIHFCIFAPLMGPGSGQRVSWGLSNNHLNLFFMTQVGDMQVIWSHVPVCCAHSPGRKEIFLQQLDEALFFPYKISKCSTQSLHVKWLPQILLEATGHFDQKEAEEPCSWL